MFKSLIVGNWKMHGTAETAVKLATQLAEDWNADTVDSAVEMIVFPLSCSGTGCRFLASQSRA